MNNYLHLCTQNADINKCLTTFSLDEIKKEQKKYVICTFVRHIFTFFIVTKLELEAVQKAKLFVVC